jgi:uncharacterized protein (TIGR03000 family)
MMVRTGLVLLSFAGIGLPQGRAQLEYNGGYVQTHREDAAEAPRMAAPSPTARSLVNMPLSYFPDNDLSYPSYYLPRTSGLRSYYYAGEFEPARLSAEPRLPFRLSLTSLPWNEVGFKDYDYPQETSRDLSRNYSLTSTLLPQASPVEKSKAAVLIAHLPEHAAFWVQGTRTRSTGQTRYFQSPPLLPDRKYNYLVRVAWLENGQWVSQTRSLLVQAGAVQAIYLRSK